MAETVLDPQTFASAIRARTPSRPVAVLDRLPVPLRLARPWLLRSNARENRDAWSRLEHASERPRYDAVRRITEQYAARGFVLDIGCSRGLLRRGLRCARYEGLDTYPAAIDAARAAHHHEFGEEEATRFVLADGAAYTPEGVPDAVVLTEVLYYLPDPLASALHYARLLAPGGALVVSASARSWTSTRLLRRLSAHLTPLDHNLVTSGSLSWRIIAFAACGS